MTSHGRGRGQSTTPQVVMMRAELSPTLARDARLVSLRELRRRPAFAVAWLVCAARDLPRIGANLAEYTAFWLAGRKSSFQVDRQDFWNSRMGLPFMDTPSALSAEKLKHLRHVYSRGHLPAGWVPDLTLLTYDVQSWGMPWVVRAWKWTGESYLIDHGIAGSWDDLESYQKVYKASHVLGDLRYAERRAEQLDATYRRASLNWGCLEGHEILKNLVELSTANAYEGGKLQSAQFKVPKIVISNYQFQCELDTRLEGKGGAVWGIPTPVDEQQEKDEADYCVQLLDERKRRRKTKAPGKPDYEYHSKNKYNHKRDCEKYQLAGFYFVRHRHSVELQRRAAANTNGAANGAVIGSIEG